MLELFRRNIFFNSLMLLPYALLVRVHSLWEPQRPDYADVLSPISTWINEMIPSLLVQNILACILVFLHAVYINRIAVKHRLTGEMTLFSGLIYIVLCSLIPAYTYLSPVLIANTFVIIAISAVFKIYKKPEAVTPVFNSGFFIGLAAMIYLPSIWIAVAAFVGLIVMRSFKVRELIQFLIGLFSSWYIMFSWWYHKGIFAQQFNSLVTDRWGWPEFLHGNQLQWILAAVIGLHLVMIVFSYNSYGSKKSIQVHKKIDILYWCMLFAGAGMVSAQLLSIDHMLLLAFPMSICLCMNLLKIKNPVVAELGHLAILVLIGLVHFGLIVL